MMDTVQHPAANLLVVDDEPNIRAPLTRALNACGYLVTEAASGRQALSLLQQTTYDLMLLDLQLPDLHGLELMQQARQICPGLLIVVLTGYPNFEHLVMATQMNVNEFLCKPASITELNDVIGRALANHPAQVGVIPPACTEDTPQRPCRFVYAYPFTLDRLKQLLTVDNAPETSLELTGSETAVMAALMSFPDNVLSCRDLAQTAWGQTLSEKEAQSMVRPCISRLRSKLRTIIKKNNLIRTVRSRGYHFVPSLGLGLVPPPANIIKKAG